MQAIGVSNWTTRITHRPAARTRGVMVSVCQSLRSACLQLGKSLDRPQSRTQTVRNDFNRDPNMLTTKRLESWTERKPHPIVVSEQNRITSQTRSLKDV
jgi:hypothetical protein